MSFDVLYSNVLDFFRVFDGGRTFSRVGASGPEVIDRLWWTMFARHCAFASQTRTLLITNLTP